MTRAATRILLFAALGWLLLQGVAMLVFYPAIGDTGAGKVAASVDPNPYWSVLATGNSTVPFDVTFKAASWLALTLAPIAVLWVVVRLLDVYLRKRSAPRSR